MKSKLFIASAICCALCIFNGFVRSIHVFDNGEEWGEIMREQIFSVKQKYMKCGANWHDITLDQMHDLMITKAFKELEKDNICYDIIKRTNYIAGELDEDEAIFLTSMKNRIIEKEKEPGFNRNEFMQVLHKDPAFIAVKANILETYKKTMGNVIWYLRHLAKKHNIDTQKINFEEIPNKYIKKGKWSGWTTCEKEGLDFLDIIQIWTDLMNNKRMDVDTYIDYLKLTLDNIYTDGTCYNGYYNRMCELIAPDVWNVLYEKGLR